MVIPLWKCGNRRLNSKLADGVTKIELRDVKWASQSRWPKMLLSLPKLVDLSIDRGSGALMPSASHLSEQLQQLPRRLKRLVLKSLESPKALLHHTLESSDSAPTYLTRHFDTGDSRMIDFPCLEDLEVRGRGDLDAHDWSGLPPSLTRLSISQYNLGSINGLQRLPRGLLELETVLWGEGNGIDAEGAAGNIHPAIPHGNGVAGGNAPLHGVAAARAPQEDPRRRKIIEDLLNLPPSLTSLSHLPSSPLSSVDLWKLIPRSVTRIGGNSIATWNVYWNARLIMQALPNSQSKSSLKSSSNPSGASPSSQAPNGAQQSLDFETFFPQSLSHLHIIHVELSTFDVLNGLPWTISLPRNLTKLHIGDHNDHQLFSRPPSLLFTPATLKALPPSLMSFGFSPMIDWSLFDALQTAEKEDDPKSQPYGHLNPPHHHNHQHDHHHDINRHYYHPIWMATRRITSISLDCPIPSSLLLTFLPDTLTHLGVTIDITHQPFDGNSLSHLSRLEEIDLGFLLSFLPLQGNFFPPHASLDACSLAGLPHSVNRLHLFAPSPVPTVFSPFGLFISSLPPSLSHLHIEHSWDTTAPYESVKNGFESLKWPPTLKFVLFENWMSSWPLSFLPPSTTFLQIARLHIHSHPDSQEIFTSSHSSVASNALSTENQLAEPQLLSTLHNSPSLDSNGCITSYMSSTPYPTLVQAREAQSETPSVSFPPTLPLLRELVVGSTGSILEYDSSGTQRKLAKVRTQNGFFLKSLPSLLSISLPSNIPFRSSCIRYLNEKFEYLDIDLIEVEEGDIARLPRKINFFAPGASFPAKSPSIVSVLPIDAFHTRKRPKPAALASALVAAKERSLMFPDPRSIIRLP